MTDYYKEMSLTDYNKLINGVWISVMCKIIKCLIVGLAVFAFVVDYPFFKALGVMSIVMLIIMYICLQIDLRNNEIFEEIKYVPSIDCQILWYNFKHSRPQWSKIVVIVNDSQIKIYKKDI